MSRQCDVKHLRDDDSVGAYFSNSNDPRIFEKHLETWFVYPGDFKLKGIAVTGPI